MYYVGASALETCSPISFANSDKAGHDGVRERALFHWLLFESDSHDPPRNISLTTTNWLSRNSTM